jgi:hypothetical protein
MYIQNKLVDTSDWPSLGAEVTSVSKKETSASASSIGDSKDKDKKVATANVNKIKATEGNSADASINAPVQADKTKDLKDAPVSVSASILHEDAQKSQSPVPDTNHYGSKDKNVPEANQVGSPGC